MAGRGSLAGMMPYGDANAVVLEMVGRLKMFCIIYVSGSFLVIFVMYSTHALL